VEVAVVCLIQAEHKPVQVAVTMEKLARVVAEEVVEVVDRNRPQVLVV
jgi:hypothetical protein